MLCLLPCGRAVFVLFENVFKQIDDGFRGELPVSVQALELGGESSEIVRRPQSEFVRSRIEVLAAESLCITESFRSLTHAVR